MSAVPAAGTPASSGTVRILRVATVVPPSSQVPERPARKLFSRQSMMLAASQMGAATVLGLFGGQPASPKAWELSSRMKEPPSSSPTKLLLESSRKMSLQLLLALGLRGLMLPPDVPKRPPLIGFRSALLQPAANSLKRRKR